MNQGHVALVVDLLERAHRWVQPELVVDLEHRIRADPQRAVARVVVVSVGVGHNAVHVVVAAGELDYDQNRVFTAGSHWLRASFSRLVRSLGMFA